ncbi:MAG: nicotinate-nucleotide adenylyltransferase [Acidimicrobiales bacterium]
MDLDRSGSGARVGILGGTFDPIHVGHLVAATWVRDSLALDRVLLVVANEPWQKTAVRDVTAAEDRFAVVAAAVEDLPGIEPSRIEIDRGGPSYMVDTVRELTADHPGTRYFLVVGSDVAADLDSWHDVSTLATLVALVVVERGGIVPGPDPAGWDVERVRIPALDVSSSELRRRLTAGQAVDVVVPAPAILCIRARGLYAGRR